MFLIDDNIYILHPFEYKVIICRDYQFWKEFGKDTKDYTVPVITEFSSKEYSVGFIGSPTIIKIHKEFLLIF